MSKKNANVVPMPDAEAAPKQLADDLIHKAVRNSYETFFEFGGRKFELKDLDYDSYIEFVKLAAPLVESVVSVVRPGLKPGDGGKLEADLDFDLSGLDMAAIADMAGSNLPKMAQLVLKQTDFTITVEDVKKLAMTRGAKGVARGPFAMVEVILKQVAHNKMVEEFAAFFPRLGSLVADLAPSLAEVAATMGPASTTEGTR